MTEGVRVRYFSSKFNLFVSHDEGKTWSELEGFRKRRQWWWFTPAETPFNQPYVQGLTVSPTNPDVILADEPSGNLDSANARELHALFFSLRKEFGQTFIIVTHNEELAAMADRKLHMKDGLMEL